MKAVEVSDDEADVSKRWTDLTRTPTHPSQC